MFKQVILNHYQNNLKIVFNPLFELMNDLRMIVRMGKILFRMIFFASFMNSFMNSIIMNAFICNLKRLLCIVSISFSCMCCFIIKVEMSTFLFILKSYFVNLLSRIFLLCLWRLFFVSIFLRNCFHFHQFDSFIWLNLNFSSSLRNYYSKDKFRAHFS